MKDMSHKERMRLISVTRKLGDETLEILFVGENQDGLDMSETLTTISYFSRKHGSFAAYNPTTSSSLQSSWSLWTPPFTSIIRCRPSRWTRHPSSVPQYL